MPRNFFFIVFLLLFVSDNVFGQVTDSLKQVLQVSIDHAKEASLYSSEVNWDSLEVVVKSKAKDASSIDDLSESFTSLINGLRDHHGKFIYNNNYFGYFTDHANTRSVDQRPRSNEDWEVVNYNTNHSYALLENNIGYIRIVGIGPDPEKHGNNIRHGIDSIAGLGATSWILDLRYNGGGNMHPMVEALSPFLADGIIGYDANLDGEILSSWKIEDHHFYYNGYNMLEFAKSPFDFSKSKVAVLTSRYTISSGEVVATVFSGRPNTFFIGETTGGYTTVTDYEYITNNLFMSIAVSIYCDRNKKIFYNNIPVDQEVEFSVEKNWRKDQGILSSISWLLK